MSRRVSLPGASELFRPTQPEVALTVVDDAPETATAPAVPATGPDPDAVAGPRSRRSPRSTGRVRHDEKITVYVSVEELLALEEARLRLRAEHGLAVDRGRIVREAISAVIADFAAHGGDSELVRKLGSR
ncbi:hypothetical protein FHX74_002889 [Friedmanniella endophytica]|uniref:Cobyrinic acid a,c-diamide synthase n=1 Tax=Microlunatus kandeliicorticis TaxID=1759536 RepID=A0A7W3IU29_9ACTN|nr:hypothetical protein [Microlunatus kandeliicorticis]MBA8795261.1 hypothetical protein [Microlunatus kandeliicorticis]